MGKKLHQAKKRTLTKKKTLTDAQVDTIAQNMVENVKNDPNLSNKEAKSLITKIWENKGKLALGLVGAYVGSKWEISKDLDYLNSLFRMSGGAQCHTRRHYRSNT